MYAVWKIDEVFGTPLTLEFTEAGNIRLEKPWTSLRYSINGGELTSYTDSGISVNAGDKVAFYAKECANVAKFSEDGFLNFSESNFMTIQVSGSEYYVYGNIMSLLTLDESGNWDPDAKSLPEYAFYELFNGNIGFKNHSEKQVYLPATSLAKNCYFNMFNGCTSLETAPVLPAATLVKECYYAMFSGCSNLKSITCLATDITAKWCTSWWLQNVAST